MLFARLTKYLDRRHQTGFLMTRSSTKVGLVKTFYMGFGARQVYFTHFGSANQVGGQRRSAGKPHGHHKMVSSHLMFQI